MAYQYDIFISYRRNSELLSWINAHFIPLLKANVQFELGREPSVFVDQDINAAGVWPLILGESISKSRILISLWSKTYLVSEWCTIELSHMLERDQLKGFRTLENPYSLIVPVIIHDGETMPVELSIVQRIEIKNFFTVRMHKDSESSEKLSQVLYSKAKDIAAAIERAPAWENDWKIKAQNSFYKKFYSLNEPVQRELTTFTVQ
ncbi:MAG: TIR domain-containing protein [Chitinophagales bacterium]